MSCCEEISLADLFHLSPGKLIKELGFPGIFNKYPHVSEWLNELSARQALLKVNPDIITHDAPVCMLKR
jgi:glutathione S-transferase